MPRPSTAIPAGSTSAADRRNSEIKKRFGRFRVLIIGRANAGKTTVLQKVCNATEDPVIYDKYGRKIDPEAITPSLDRGRHNIEHEMLFRSSPGFVFHDSRGFEAGGVAEFNTVKAFISERAKRTRLQDQLHAIWYCIPVDDDRPFTKAENNFFSECGTGNVPVVVLFTKFDALDDKAYQELEEEGISWNDAKRHAPRRALTNFENMHLDNLYRRKYRPKAHVYLRDMNTPEANCNELLERTAAALSNDVLQLLLASTQQTNLQLCMQYALKRDVMKQIIKAGSSTVLSRLLSSTSGKVHDCRTVDDFRKTISRALKWFPFVVSLSCYCASHEVINPVDRTFLVSMFR